MNAIRILARLKGKPVDAIGTTTARPFFHPVPMSHLAGADSTRAAHTDARTPPASRCECSCRPAAGLRPEYYQQAGAPKPTWCVPNRLPCAVAWASSTWARWASSKCTDPHAAEFLERVYTGRFANMKVGSTRYALMLDESGVIIDDGVVARSGRTAFLLHHDHHAAPPRYLSRVSAAEHAVAAAMSASSMSPVAYAAMNLAGPKSRELLRQLTST